LLKAKGPKPEAGRLEESTMAVKRPKRKV